MTLGTENICCTSSRGQRHCTYFGQQLITSLIHTSLADISLSDGNKIGNISEMICKMAASATLQLFRPADEQTTLVCFFSTQELWILEQALINLFFFSDCILFGDFLDFLNVRMSSSSRGSSKGGTPSKQLSKLSLEDSDLRPPTLRSLYTFLFDRHTTWDNLKLW